LAFTKLLTILSSQIGDKVSINELSNTIGISKETISNYLWYLEKTYIIKTCRPYYTNIRSELSKAPLYYFVDSGIRNYILHRFTNFNLIVEGGHMFENFIFNFLRHKYSKFNPEINYWRTKDGAEVDFILRLGREILPIEVKYRKLKRPTLGKSFCSFISKYAPKKGYLINLTQNTEITKDHTKIIFTNFPNFLIEEFIEKTDSAI